VVLLSSLALTSTPSPSRNCGGGRAGGRGARRAMRAPAGPPASEGGCAREMSERMQAKGRLGSNSGPPPPHLDHAQVAGLCRHVQGRHAQQRVTPRQALAGGVAPLALRRQHPAHLVQAARLHGPVDGGPGENGPPVLDRRRHRGASGAGGASDWELGACGAASCGGRARRRVCGGSRVFSVRLEMRRGREGTGGQRAACALPGGERQSGPRAVSRGRLGV
jgi:hypothetical protein